MNHTLKREEQLHPNRETIILAHASIIIIADKIILELKVSYHHHHGRLGKSKHLLPCACDPRYISKLESHPPLQEENEILFMHTFAYDSVKTRLYLKVSSKL